MLRAVLLSILFIFVTTPVSAETTAASGVSAEDKASVRPTMQNTLDSIVAVVKQFPGDEKKSERREKLREVISPKFDFAEMAMRSLGVHWKDINQAQRDEYVKLFSDLLARTYLSRIETIQADTVKIDNEKVLFPKAIVKTTVKYKGDTFPIDYRLMYAADKWKVYDVVIENIGLVANYRNEFAGIIRKEKFEGLIEKLRAKNS